MIFDKLSNIEKYYGIYSNLNVALEYIYNNDLSKLKKGRTSILGDDVYINVTDAELIENGIFEWHEKYIDLHVDITGEEIIRFADKDNIKIQRAFEKEADYGLASGVTKAEVLLDKTTFVICMLGEPHMPCIKAGGNKSVCKAIVKIKVDE